MDTVGCDSLYVPLGQFKSYKCFYFGTEKVLKYFLVLVMSQVICWSSSNLLIMWQIFNIEDNISNLLEMLLALKKIKEERSVCRSGQKSFP